MNDVPSVLLQSMRLTVCVCVRALWQADVDAARTLWEAANATLGVCEQDKALVTQAMETLNQDLRNEEAREQAALQVCASLAKRHACLFKPQWWAWCQGAGCICHLALPSVWVRQRRSSAEDRGNHRPGVYLGAHVQLLRNGAWGHQLMCDGGESTYLAVDGSEAYAHRAPDWGCGVLCHGVGMVRA